MRTTTFVNGTFDILHPGHIMLLKYAKALGNYLVVAIDSDERVAELKGSNRPINNLDSRIIMLESLKCVDRVYHFGTDKELEDLVKRLSPRFMVVGSEYKDKKVIGSEYAKELRFFERIDGLSTTSIIQNITTR